VPYLSALEACSRQGAIQIHVYLTLKAVYVVEILTALDDYLPFGSGNFCGYKPHVD